MIKALILAGGQGRALLPFTKTTPKPLIEIMGRPILDYIIEGLHDSGIRNIVIVTGFHGDKIVKRFGNGSSFGVSIEYVDQGEKYGIEAAILSAEKKISGEDEFLLVYSDIITDKEIFARTLDARDTLSGDMAIAVTLHREADKFGPVEVTGDGYVRKIHAPHAAGDWGNYVAGGVFLLTSDIWEPLNQGIPLNKTIEQLATQGKRVAVGVWERPWFDIGKPWNIIRANRFMLSKIKHTSISTKADIHSSVEIKGPVIIEDNVQIQPGAVIQGPVYIGRDSYIGNFSLIRDHTSIHRDVLIGFNVEIKNSLVFSGASIYRMNYVGDSIIGQDVKLNSGFMTVISHLPPGPIWMNISGNRVETGMTKLGAFIGAETTLGLNSMAGPGVKIGTNVIVKQGSIITEDIDDDMIVEKVTETIVKKRLSKE